MFPNVHKANKIFEARKNVPAVKITVQMVFLARTSGKDLLKV